MAALSDKDMNDAIDTIISEAVGGGMPGMQAVAYVIANRAREKGISPGEVVRAKGQFSGYYAPGSGTLAAREDNAVRQQALTALNNAITQTVPDPTSGATYFVQKGTTASWAPSMQNAGTIGGNTFYVDPKSKSAATVANAPEPAPASYRPTGSVSGNAEVQMAYAPGATSSALSTIDSAAPASSAIPPPPTTSMLTYTNQDAKRNLAVSSTLEDQIKKAVAAVYGPNYSVEIMSGGQGDESRGVVGTRRHTTGAAADIYVKNPDGSRVEGNALLPLAQTWLSDGIGSVGFPSNGQSMHLDLLGGKGSTALPLKGGESNLWYYGDPTSYQRKALFDGTLGIAPTFPAPPIAKPTSIAVAQRDASMMPSVGASAAARSQTAPMATVDQIANEANRYVSSTQPTEVPAPPRSTVSPKTSGVDTSSLAGVLKASGTSTPAVKTPESVNDLGPEYVDGSSAGSISRASQTKAVPAPPPTADVAARQMATVTTPPTAYRVDLDKALGYARETGELSGIPAMLPNSALYGPAQDQIAQSLPEGATYDRNTSTVKVQNRGLLTNPPIDHLTGKPADISTYIEKGIATPVDEPKTETFPLPIKRPNYGGLMSTSDRPVSPQARPASADSYGLDTLPTQDRSSALARALTGTTMAGVSAPVARALSGSTVRPIGSGVDTSSLAGIMKASGFNGPATNPRVSVSGSAQYRAPRVKTPITAPFISGAAQAQAQAQAGVRRPAVRQVTVPVATRRAITPPPQSTAAVDAYNRLRQSQSTSERSNNEVGNAAGAVSAGRMTENQARSLLYSGAPF